MFGILRIWALKLPWRLKHVLLCLVFILVFSLDMFSALDSVCEELTSFYLTFEITKTWPKAWLNCSEFLKSLPKDKCDNLSGRAWASQVVQWSRIHLQCRSNYFLKSQEQKLAFSFMYGAFFLPPGKLCLIWLLKFIG